MQNDWKQNSMVAIEPLNKLAEIAKLDKDKNIQKFLMAIGVSNDSRMANDFIKIIHPKAVYESLQKYPFSQPSNDILQADLLNNKFLLIGKIKRTTKPFLYTTDLFNQHGLILGGTGTGKTNLIYGLSLQCMRQGVAVWHLDKDKQDYRHLRRFNPDLLVFDAQENLAINPLQPPKNVKPKHWIPTFVTIFAKSNSLLDGSESLLIKAIYELYEKYGVFNGKDTYPTIIDLFERIVSYNFRGNSRAVAYQDSIVNRLQAYIATNRKVYEYSKGLPIEEFAKKSLVIEVKGLSEKIARFTINIIFYALFLYRIASGQRGNSLRNLVVVDEGKWLAPPGFNENLSFSPLTYVLAQARETGIGLLMADQSAQLEDSIFVNSRIKLCFRLGSGNDIEKAKQTMALTREQADYITKLDTGECIVRIPKEDPFVLQIPKVKLQ